MASINDYLKKAKQGLFVLTKYLDSQELSELHQIKDSSIDIYYNGGYELAERQRAIIIPRGDTLPKEEEFEIALLEIELADPNASISHRHVLGTLMSFGFKRDNLGDIIVSDKIYLFTTVDMAQYIINQLTSINHIPTKVTIKENHHLPITIKEEELNINVASLRLDAVIAKVLNKARSDTQELITQGLVQVNHIEKTNPSYFVKEGDLISIRHFGRITIGEVVSTTKKDRLILRVFIQH